MAKAQHFSFFAGDFNSLPTLEQVVLFLATAWLYIIYRKVRPHPIPASLPGPKRYPVAGILPYKSKHAEDWPGETARLTKKYGRTWGGPVPNVPGIGGAVFYIVDEVCTYHVLSKNFDNYEKGESVRELLSDMLGKGIFTSDGDEWRVHRKIMSNMFSRNLMRHTSKVVLSKLEQIASMFEKTIKAKGAGGTVSTISVDMQDIFFEMTFDTTLFVALGYEMNSVGIEGGQHSFPKAFDEMQRLIGVRSIDPFFRIKRWLQIGARERRISALKRIISRYTAEIINGRRRSVEDGDELGPDLLSRYLDYGNKKGITMDDEELKDTTVNILLAGRDTTASALSWALYELTKQKHSSVVQKILKEVEDICGVEKDADYSYDTISNLSYTHAVVMEVLRLHPSVANDFKFAVNHDVLPDGTVIPAGSMVVWLPFAMGRSERIWGEDASEFKPERFLGAKEPSPYKYLVFNAGPRTCLGKPLAIHTMMLALAYLLPQFQFVDRIGHSGDYQQTLVCAMKGGFEVDVSKREKGE